MKIQVFLFLMIFGVNHTSAQENILDIGLEGGGGLVFLKNDMFSSGCKPAYNFPVGITLQYNTPRIFSIRTGLYYEVKQTETKERIMIPNSNFWGTFEDILVENKLYYLTLPVLGQVTYGHKIRYFANGGIFIGYLLQQDDNYGTTHFYDNLSEHKHLDLGISAGIGLSVPISERLYFSLQLKSDFGCYKIFKPSTWNLSTNQNERTNSTALLLSISYKFKKRPYVNILTKMKG